ncbi:hypothetical protein B0E38_01818 [Streptomyces sp. 111WW2]|uniref:hypothetical protein n=1 Tax=Streptomyces sp. 111WW2 TaxID=1945515 RepID=UPI000D0C87D7|nr:hypothetical protein [Streptomyces sp. 111WW2]PSK57973.1 hypothetical protein B0E38_01818 [Streptomyces sp. 111WW2]
MTAPAPVPRRALTASAARYTARRLRSKPVDGSWQGRAWDFYDEVPEVRFAARWYANAMSRSRLFAGHRDKEGNVVPLPPDHRASQLVAEIAAGPNGQSQLLGKFGPHLVVPGECWIIVRPQQDNKGREVGADWRVLSTKEVKPQGQKLVIELDGEESVIPGVEDENAPIDASEPVAIRVWESHPGRHLEADSAVRSSLGLLEELKLLNAAVAAIARSRLTGRGIVLVPQGTKFPTTPTQQNEEDDLIEVLMTVAETAYKEPDSAAATVPIILEVPADQIPNIKRLTFESDFDTLAIQLREEAITRFANGLEVPAEILLGQGDINHWGQWALKDEAITLGVEPKLGTVVDALTSQYLRPLLEAENVADAYDCLVWYDTSPLRVRTNRAETALKVHEAGAISDAALRRETGFTETDAPSEDERRRRKKTPETGEDIKLPVDESEAEPEQPSEVPSEADDLPAAAVTAALRRETILAAVDGLLYAAMYAVGEKLRTKPACPRSERARARDIPPAELHTVFPVDPEQVDAWRLLDGAWDRIPEIAARYGLDPECLTDTLDEYARALIAARMAHSFDETTRLLKATCMGLAA